LKDDHKKKEAFTQSSETDRTAPSTETLQDSAELVKEGFSDALPQFFLDYPESVTRLFRNKKKYRGMVLTSTQHPVLQYILK